MTLPLQQTCPSCGKDLASAACRCLSCGWSLTACYFGVLGLLLPLVGLFFAVPALACALVALARQRGAGSRDVHPLLGLSFGLVGTLTWGAVWLYLLRKGSP